MFELLNEFFATPIVSMLVGASITWYVAWLYYKRAGQELQAEAKRLRATTDLIVYCLAHPDAKVTPKYDTDGSVCGLYVNMEANLSGSGDLRANLTQ